MVLRRLHAASAMLALLLLLSTSLERARALDQRLLFRDGLQPRGQPGGYDGAYEVVRAGLRQMSRCFYRLCLPRAPSAVWGPMRRST